MYNGDIVFEGGVMGTACLMVSCYLLGWIVAHKTVANECKRLGKFYVGKEVFHCIKVED